MASPSARSGSSSSRSTNTLLMPGRIVIACDATKSHYAHELKDIVAKIKARKAMIQEVDTITVLGVLHKVLHPMGFQMQIGPSSFIGARLQAIKEEVARMVDIFVRMLHHSAEECDADGVAIEVKIVVGAALKNVVVQEAVTSNATWVVLNRHLKKELRFYLGHIPCKMAMVLDNSSLEILRSYYSDKATANIEQKVLYTQCKVVSPFTVDNEQQLVSPSLRSICSQESSDTEQSCITSTLTPIVMEQNILPPEESNRNPQPEIAGIHGEVEANCGSSAPPTDLKEQSAPNSSYASVNSAATEANFVRDLIDFINDGEQIAMPDYLPRQDADREVKSEPDDSSAEMQNPSGLDKVSDEHREPEEMKTGIARIQCSYSEVQSATDNFSRENLLGEGEYGAVYKGRLRGGELIVAKVQKEADRQADSEFLSEVLVLSMACHKNIVMLLGYCLEGNRSILMYEYLCNRTLEWHLFGKQANLLDEEANCEYAFRTFFCAADNTEDVLEWHQRHAIAVGIAKGLRFLHEECRGSPIVHRDLRPSNVFLTHEFVPMLGDCGLSTWTTNKLGEHSKILEYHAPEYAENGICSAKTDVFAFGIVLIQLISGRKATNPTSDDSHKSIRQWATPLIQTLALDELVDPRLGDSYSTYELYQMSQLAYSCVQSKPALRPTIGEALPYLEGKSNHLNYLRDQFKPDFSNVPRAALLQTLVVQP
ncbi:inactive protein kinase SELMODRAFT_444075-like isoform X2 [Andrographis paniculata]|uniref:inactive protein kinase SELMODRAFT_444075-like isoform X2 n=1 Tax=Andrographis paniculata TaxID=175694 RepID=UPI0021E83188|nr:inactive protein kinase SELMODRAFT_444075-like isoform X2 [Andrographis paniculata]